LQNPAGPDAAERVITQTGPRSAGIDDDGLTFADDDPTVSVAEAARLLGRDPTRVYALLRSGDLVAARDDEDGAGPARILRASVDRWLLAGGASGAPLSPATNDLAAPSISRLSSALGDCDNQRAEWTDAHGP
jgi:hypothetical protein